MAKIARGERMIKIFVYLMAHYNNRYTITEIMHNLDIPKRDLRSIQRDMQSLIDVDWVLYSKAGGVWKNLLSSGA